MKFAPPLKNIDNIKHLTDEEKAQKQLSNQRVLFMRGNEKGDANQTAYVHYLSEKIEENEKRRDVENSGEKKDNASAASADRKDKKHVKDSNKDDVSECLLLNTKDEVCEPEYHFSHDKTILFLSSNCYSIDTNQVWYVDLSKSGKDFSQDFVLMNEKEDGLWIKRSIRKVGGTFFQKVVFSGVLHE